MKENKKRTIFLIRLLKAILFILVLFNNSCDEKKKKIDTKADNFLLDAEPKLPTEKTIDDTINKNESQFKRITSELGLKNIKQLEQKFMSSIGNEELDFYYSKNRPQGIGEDIELVGIFRHQIKRRLAWKKIFLDNQIAWEGEAFESKKINVSSIDLNSESSFGNKNSDIIILEYSDYECTYCSKFQPVKKKILEKYGDKVFWIFKNFPLYEKHENAYLAHIASFCALETSSEKYHEYHFKLFDNYRSLNRDLFLKIAKELNIEETWKSCMNSSNQKEVIMKKIDKEIAEGKKLGVVGTPSFVIQDQLFKGARSYEGFERILLTFLKKEKKKPKE
ncbi:MAG: thioredoxin domain-containing protein [Leptospiraceae bacterium]|nr:thioredoxin domain-containing protein [Leptospiraceae bacterium]